MKKTLLTLILLSLLGSTAVMAQETATTPTQSQQEKYEKFTGKIGPYAITLNFNPQVTVGNNSGYYYYNDRPQNHFTLILKFYEAKMREDATGMPVAWGHHWILEEYSPKGNHTGTFDGIEVTLGDGFEGTFTNQKGEQLLFELVRQYDK